MTLEATAGLPQDLINLAYTSTVISGQVFEGISVHSDNFVAALGPSCFETSIPGALERPWSWADQDDGSPVCGFLKVCMSCYDFCRSCEGGVAGVAVSGLQVAAAEAGTSESPRQGSRWAGVLGMKQSRCGERAVLSAGDRPGIRTRWVVLKLTTHESNQ